MTGSTCTTDVVPYPTHFNGRMNAWKWNTQSYSSKWGKTILDSLTQLLSVWMIIWKEITMSGIIFPLINSGTCHCQTLSMCCFWNGLLVFLLFLAKDWVDSNTFMRLTHHGDAILTVWPANDSCNDIKAWLPSPSLWCLVSRSLWTVWLCELHDPPRVPAVRLHAGREPARSQQADRRD